MRELGVDEGDELLFFNDGGRIVVRKGPLIIEEGG
jgi:bifunctional DNA-binding transcriptional regulator/antitoxin component of YhaV-PrlF toxin-antitoxin module